MDVKLEYYLIVKAMEIKCLRRVKGIARMKMFRHKRLREKLKIE